MPSKSKQYSEVPTSVENEVVQQDKDETDDIPATTVSTTTTTTTDMLSSTSLTNDNDINSTSEAMIQQNGKIIREHDEDARSNTITVDEAIERLGMGTFQLIVLTGAGLCFAADAMQVILLSFLSEVLRLEWNLNDDETAFITSILFIGAIFGTLTLGPLADRRGRKPVFLLAAAIISCFGTAVALATNYWALLANLFMVGWGVGGLTGEIIAIVLNCQLDHL